STRASSSLTESLSAGAAAERAAGTGGVGSSVGAGAGGASASAGTGARRAALAAGRGGEGGAAGAGTTGRWTSASITGVTSGSAGTATGAARDATSDFGARDGRCAADTLHTATAPAMAAAEPTSSFTSTPDKRPVFFARPAA